MYDVIEQGAAALGDILPRLFKVAGIPWVGDIARTLGIVHQQADLVPGIVGDDAADVAQVVVIHQHDIVEADIIGGGHLPGGLAGTGDAVLHELAPRGRVDGAAELLAAGGG